jgi:hypothetical protein
MNCPDTSPDRGRGGLGGAIASRSGTVRILRSAIINNRAGDGGDYTDCSGNESRGGNGGLGGRRRRCHDCIRNDVKTEGAGFQSGTNSRKRRGRMDT